MKKVNRITFKGQAYITELVYNGKEETNYCERKGVRIIPVDARGVRGGRNLFTIGDGFATPIANRYNKDTDIPKRVIATAFNSLFGEGTVNLKDWINGVQKKETEINYIDINLDDEDTEEEAIETLDDTEEIDENPKEEKQIEEEAALTKAEDDTEDTKDKENTEDKDNTLKDLKDFDTDDAENGDLILIDNEEFVYLEPARPKRKRSGRR